MGLPLTTEHYKVEQQPFRIIRRRPKFPKGKAEIKLEKRRTHQKRYYYTQKLLKQFKLI